MNPIQIVKHESGAESDRIPLIQIVIDALSLVEEAFLVGVKFSVVVQIVNADFKSTLD